MAIALQIIGSNSAAFAHSRHQTSQMLKIQDQYVLIDCGEGTQLLLKRYKIKVSKISTIVISHLHGDHYYGLIGLLSTLHLFGRQKELVLVGPPGLRDIITLQLKYSETLLNFKIDFVEWVPNTVTTVYDHPKFTITTIPLDHRVPCAGYLFKEKPKKKRINKAIVKERLEPFQIFALKSGEDVLDMEGNVKYKNSEVTLPPYPSYSYAFCSDTRFKPDIVEQIKEVDILYHEATFTDEMASRAEQTYHSTAKQAGQIASDAKAKKLLIGHFSTRYKNLTPVLEEAQSVFPNTELAQEGHIFCLNDE